MTTARGWQQAEGAGIALGGLLVAVLAAPGGPWWGWILALLAPDLSMLGYVAGPRIGAIIYNVLHIFAVPFLLMVLGVALGATWLIWVAGLWLAHIGFDRALGMGLRLPTGLRETHLGGI